jgi:recombination protein RecT
MGRKTALRRLFKYLPVSIELATAAALDDRSSRGESQGLDEALNGDFSVIDSDAERYQDDNETVDTSTGEVTRNEPPALGLQDAIAAADAGDIETAQDISRSLSQRDRDQVEAYLNKPEQGPAVQHSAPAPRQRQARNLD